MKSPKFDKKKSRIIGLDFHGVIDTYPDFFIPKMQEIITKGHEVHIITGNEDTPAFREQLASLGMRSGEHWWKIFSVVSYHKNIGTPIRYDEKNTPWLDEELWNRSKADYCRRQAVDILIDDSYVYGKYFGHIPTAYIHIDTFNILRNLEMVGW